jgi:hypothetical protein
VYRGVRHELALGPDDAPNGPTYLAALGKFTAIMEGNAKKAEGTAPATVREVLDTYLKHISKSKKPGTVEIRLRSFEPFVNFTPEGAKACHGEKPVTALTHLDVYRFLEHMETVPRYHRRRKEQKGRKPVTWGPGSQRNFVQGVTAAFNWAVTAGMIPKNPALKITSYAAGAGSRVTLWPNFSRRLTS